MSIKKKAQLDKITADVDEFVGVYAQMAAADKQLGELVAGLYVAPVCEITTLIKRLPAKRKNTAIDGFSDLINLIRKRDTKRKNTESLIAAFSSGGELKPEPASRFLELLHKAAVGLTFDRSKPPSPSNGKGLHVLAESINGKPNAAGVWYQLRLAESLGWKNIRQLETDLPSGRGFDIELDKPDPKTGARFFEAKNKKALTEKDHEQFFKHLEALTVSQQNPLTLHRIVLNRDPKSAAFLAEVGGLLDFVSAASVPPNQKAISRKILIAVRDAIPGMTDARIQKLTKKREFTLAAKDPSMMKGDLKKVFDEFQRQFFLGREFNIAVP